MEKYEYIVVGFFGGLIIAVITVIIGFMLFDIIVDILLTPGQDAVNAALGALIYISAVVVIAGIIGWIVVAWLFRISQQKKAEKDSS